MAYLFTSESVSEGHPDKIADQISDALLDNFLAYDPQSKVACETLVTTGQVVMAGEVKSDTYIDLQSVARDVINRIGYTKAEYRFDGDSCGVISMIHEQSDDINRGVDAQNEKNENKEQGAGDQGMMFGYACRETSNYMPLPLELSHRILKELSLMRREGTEIPYLRPDAKSQVTIEYSDDNIPQRIDTIVVSTQHDEFDTDDQRMLAKIKSDIIEKLIPRVKAKCEPEIQRLFTDRITYHVNPTGKFVIGGPHGDTGLTGRKIIVDTYGGKGAHGGGAFSGKDPSKVDRSAAYAARHIAKNLVAAGVADEVLVQVSYAIGVVEPTSIYVNTYGTSHVDFSDGEIAKIVNGIFDMRPSAIERRLKLRNPIYQETASYGHVGREPMVVTKHFHSDYFGDKDLEVELFTWEKLDYVDKVKAALALSPPRIPKKNPAWFYQAGFFIEIKRIFFEDLLINIQHFRIHIIMISCLQGPSRTGKIERKQSPVGQMPVNLHRNIAGNRRIDQQMRINAFSALQQHRRLPRTLEFRCREIIIDLGLVIPVDMHHGRERGGAVCRHYLHAIQIGLLPRRIGTQLDRDTHHRASMIQSD